MLITPWKAYVLVELSFVAAIDPDDLDGHLQLRIALQVADADGRHLPGPV